MDFLSLNVAYLSTLPGKGQVEAERATGIGQSAVSKIATGKTREAGYRTVARLAAFYGTTIDDLVTRDLQSEGPSQLARPEDETMAQALDLLYLMADARPDDKRFNRPNWNMVLVAAKAVHRHGQRAAMKAILESIEQEA